MKLKLLFKDREYLKALVDAFSRSDKEFFAEIARDLSMKPDTLLLTDRLRCEFSDEAIRRIGAGTVFLTPFRPDGDISGEGPYEIFKYERVSEMLADLHLCYYLYTGEKSRPSGHSRKLAVFSDSASADSTAISEIVARHTAYDTGGRVLLLPLGYLSRSSCGDTCDMRIFRRFMYFAEQNRDFPADFFFRRDEYGVYRVPGFSGLNPFSRLDSAVLDRLTDRLAGKYFDTVVLDIGAFYSEANLGVIRKADSFFYIVTDPVNSDKVLGEITEGADSIDIFTLDVCSGGFDAGLACSDAVRRIYGTGGSS
jgi:hypothetical protein